MAENPIYYCRKCGVKLPLSGIAVQKHYEKVHFSDWTRDKELMGRMPKAFLVTEAKQVQTTKNVVKAVAAEAAELRAKEVPDTDESKKQREANKAAVMEKLAKCVEKLPYKESEPFHCPCCGRDVYFGMKITCTRERLNLCRECYNETRLSIPHKTRPI